jgi:limonene-1,2-epoxide hydrolase
MSGHAVMDPAQTVIRFFRALDDRDYHVLVALLAPDGVWHRQGKELRGEANIVAAMSSRSPTMRIHHLLTNVFAEPQGQDEAAVTGYMLVVRHDAKAELPGPAPLSGIENIRTIRARLRHTPQGWRILQLGGDPVSFEAA